MEWFTLTMLCSFSLATADAYTKKHLSHYSGLEMVLVRSFIPGLLLIPLIYFYPLPQVSKEFWAWIVVLVPLELLAMLLYTLAIRDSPLYQTLPFLAFTPVFNIFTAWAILGEQVTLDGAIGIVLIVVGAYLLNINRLYQASGLNWLAPFFAIVKQKGSRRMLIVAIIYSFTSVGGKAAMSHVGAMNFAAFYIPVVGISALLLVATIQVKGVLVLVRKPSWHLFIGVMFTIMLVTHFLALSKVEAAYMVAVKRSSLLFGILYGAWLFHEKNLLKNSVSASLMVAGVAIIVLR
jgi:drug/metabolite transporter (DMT)-like permease